MNAAERTRTHVTTARALLTGALTIGALLAALTGCDVAGTSGEAGELTFHDTTRVPGEFIQTDQRLDRDIAEGALLDLAIRRNDIPVDATSAVSSDPSVLSVVRVDGDVLLRAEAPGKARITVEAAGTKDTVLITVSAVGQTVVHLYPVGELAADKAALDVSLAVLLPGARIWGFVEQRAPDGRTLTGYGATPCAVDAGASVSMAADGDGFTLDAPTAKGDEDAVVLSCGPTEVTLPLATADAAVTLEAFDFLGEAFGPELVVEPGQATYVVVLARDADGVIVQGSVDELATVTVPEASAPYVEVVPHEGDTELDAILRQSRAVELRVSEGKPSHAVTLGWHGLTYDLTLTLGKQE